MSKTKLPKFKADSFGAYNQWRVKRQEARRAALAKRKARMADPLVREIDKAYRATERFKLDKLKAERCKWKRKATVASNKLLAIEDEITELCDQLCERVDPKS